MQNSMHSFYSNLQPGNLAEVFKKILENFLNDWINFMWDIICIKLLSKLRCNILGLNIVSTKSLHSSHGWDTIHSKYWQWFAMLVTEVSLFLLINLLFCWVGRRESVIEIDKPDPRKFKPGEIFVNFITQPAVLFFHFVLVKCCFRLVYCSDWQQRHRHTDTTEYTSMTDILFWGRVVVWLIFYEVKISRELSDITQNTS